MGYQLSIDVLRAARLTDDLREQRKQAEEQFRLVVGASPNGVGLVNGRRRVVLVNRESERLFGYARDELLGMSVERLVPERFRDDQPGSRAAFLATPRARTMGLGRELFARPKGGRAFACANGFATAA